MNNKKIISLTIFFVIWAGYVFLEYKLLTWLMMESGYISIRKAEVTFSKLTIFLLTVFVFPLVEEIMYRLPLSLKRIHILAALITAIWYEWFLWLTFSIGVENFKYFYLILPIAATLPTIILLTIRPKLIDKVLIVVRTRYYKPLVFLSILLFTVAHYSKIEYADIFHLAIFMVAVYFMLGLFLSFVRIKLNFGMALMFHVLHNSLPYLFVIGFT